MRRKKIVKYTVAAGIIVGVLVIAIAYRTTVKNTSRRSLSFDKASRYAISHQTLQKEYGAKKVSFTTSDDIKLAGYLIERNNPRSVVLLCHGYGMVKEDMRHYLDLFPNDTVLLFDFRAHGESGGDLISLGFYEQRDIRAAADFLRKQCGELVPLIGLGVSMGGATLLESAAAGVRFEGLIVDATFANLQKHLEHAFILYTGLPATLFMPLSVALYTYRASSHPKEVMPVKAIAAINCPVVIIHSKADAQTPVANAYELYNAAHEPKILWVVQDSEHAGIIHDHLKEYKKQVDSFLATL